MDKCKYYREESGNNVCWGQKNAPRVNCQGDYNKCESDYKEGYQIDIMAAIAEGLSGKNAVCMINAIKYLLEWKECKDYNKLNKAIWFIRHLNKE